MININDYPNVPVDKVERIVKDATRFLRSEETTKKVLHVLNKIWGEYKKKTFKASMVENLNGDGI